MSSVKLRGIVKKFGSFVALPHLDLDIADKEFAHKDKPYCP